METIKSIVYKMLKKTKDTQADLFKDLKFNDKIQIIMDLRDSDLTPIYKVKNITQRTENTVELKGNKLGQRLRCFEWVEMKIKEEY